MSECVIASSASSLADAGKRAGACGLISAITASVTREPSHLMPLSAARVNATYLTLSDQLVGEESLCRRRARLCTARGNSALKGKLVSIVLCATKERAEFLIVAVEG